MGKNGKANSLSDILCSVWIDRKLNIDKELYGDPAVRKRDVELYARYDCLVYGWLLEDY